VSTLELTAIEKSFGSTPVIQGVDLTVAHGEFVVFVGPSGCGKSTLLRMIAGLDHPTRGDVRIDGERVNEIGAADRGCAMVFQSYALYPHMSVYANMAFGLENVKTPKAEIEAKVRDAAALLKLDTLLERRPTQLSGGQRQRVAIGRAIVRDPKIFLFDEPLSNLDAELRVSMRAELSELHQRLGATMIYVTHDQVEAMTMADRIVVLRAGKIEQVGAPKELYERPANAFVAGFIGSPRMNFLPAALARQIPSLGAQIPANAHQVGIRPEHWMACEAGLGLALKVVRAEYLGASCLVKAQATDGTDIEVLLSGGVALPAGSAIDLSAPAQHMHAFDSTGLSLTTGAQV
jgi:ABC-type sugar transport system ATPase subunit